MNFNIIPIKLHRYQTVMNNQCVLNLEESVRYYLMFTLRPAVLSYSKILKLILYTTLISESLFRNVELGHYQFLSEQLAYITFTVYVSFTVLSSY